MKHLADEPPERGPGEDAGNKKAGRRHQAVGPCIKGSQDASMFRAMCALRSTCDRTGSILLTYPKHGVREEREDANRNAEAVVAVDVRRGVE